MKIITSIAGFSGERFTLLSVLDQQTGVLVVAKKIKFREARDDASFVFVSNMDLPSQDFRFRDDQFREAIDIYLTKMSQQLITYEPTIISVRPDTKLQTRRVDEKGRVYEVAEDINNGQVAVLATAYFVEKNRAFKAGMTAVSALSDRLYRIRTIGN